MSNKLYEENDIQAIATAIREKNGSTDTYKVSEMSTTIDTITEPIKEALNDNGIYGKNLIDDSKRGIAVNNVYVGTGDTSTTMRYKAGIYTISTNYACAIQILANKDGGKYSQNNATLFTFELTQDDDIRIRLQKVGLVPNEIKWVQVEKGSVATEYEPYNTFNIPEISNKIDTVTEPMTEALNEKGIYGKNRFDIGTDKNEYFKTGNNGIQISAGDMSFTDINIEGSKLISTYYNNTGYPWLSKYVTLPKNTDITISGLTNSTVKIVGATDNAYQTAGTQLASLSSSVKSKTFNSGDYEYYFISFYPNTNNYFENLQIEIGDKATDYEPYNTFKLVEIPQAISDIPSGDDGYQILKDTSFQISNTQEGKAYLKLLNVDNVKSKNLFNSVYKNGSGKGVSYTLQESEIILNGTSNGSGDIASNSSMEFTLPAGTYYFYANKISGSVTLNSINTGLWIKNSSGTQLVNLTTSGLEKDRVLQTLTFNTPTTIYIHLYITGSGCVFTNYKVGFMFTKVYDLDYTPFGYVGIDLENSNGKVHDYMKIEKDNEIELDLITGDNSIQTDTDIKPTMRLKYMGYNLEKHLKDISDAINEKQWEESKNYFDLVQFESTKISDVTIARDRVNDLLTFNGTNTIDWEYSMNSLTLPAGTYTIFVEENLPNTLFISLDNIAGTMLHGTTIKSTWTINEETTYRRIYIWCGKNTAFNNTKIKLRIKKDKSMFDNKYKLNEVAQAILDIGK